MKMSLTENLEPVISKNMGFCSTKLYHPFEKMNAWPKDF
jgi:hypothetical protein